MMTKKHRKTGKARRTTMKKPFCNALKLEHLYLTPRKKRRGVILRDNCKLYAAENAEDQEISEGERIDMTIKERITTAAKDLGSRAKDTVRKTVAPTDLERMAKIKSETARRKHENERKKHYVKALEEREAARRKSESLRKRELKARGDSGAKRVMQQIGQNSIGMGGSDFLGLPQGPRRSSNARKEQSLPAGPRWNTIWDQGFYGNEGTAPTRRSNRRKKSRKR